MISLAKGIYRDFSQLLRNLVAGVLFACEWHMVCKLVFAKLVFAKLVVVLHDFLDKKINGFKECRILSIEDVSDIIEN